MQNSKLARVLVAGAATLVCGAAVPASAQYASVPTYIGMTPQNEGVLDRPRPEYDAKGIPLGAFRLYPVLGASANYDDNIFRRPDAVADWFFTILPSLRLDSQWGRHFLEFYANADVYEYSKYSDENLADWEAGGVARYDISHAATFAVRGFYAERHEQWWSPNIVGFQKKPNRYYQGHGEAEWKYQPDRLGIELGGSFDRYDWLDTPAIGGGMLSNQDRNEDEYEAYAKVFYDFSPGYSMFVRGTYDDRQFDLTLDRSGLDRQSHGYRVQGGLDMQVSHLVHGEVFVGYLDQVFKAPLSDVSGLDFGAKLDWYASPVLTLHLEGSRQLQDVTLDQASTSDNRSVSLSADYEFRPNVILQVQGYYVDSKYAGTPYTDRYPGVNVGVAYLINRYLSANLNYNYSSRSTDRVDVKYTDSVVSVGLTLHV